MPNMYESKSEASWSAGLKCLDAGQIDAAANRIYYAVFQAIKGCGVDRGEYSSGEDRDVHSLATKTCGINPGGRNCQRTFEDLKKLRKKADYMTVSVNEAELRRMLENANGVRKAFLKAVP